MSALGRVATAVWPTVVRARWIGTSPGGLPAPVDALQLNYVVITSVDRDDLEDGGASPVC